jgi:hypothetical protein
MQSAPSLNGTIEALEKSLRAEKSALLDGRYEALGEIAREKERLSGALDALLLDRANTAQQSVFRKRLATIARLAQENEQLLSAAKLGVASAKARIKDIINRQRNIGVYSENGDRPFVPDAGVTRQKFA